MGLWRIIDGGLREVRFDAIDSEARLEDALATNPDLLGLDIMVVGKQVATAFGKRIDVLGVDQEGVLHVIELKRDRTPREVVAQVLDYGSWVRGLGYDDIVALHDEARGVQFEVAFAERFGVNPPDELNPSHRLYIVASELDASTERIVAYLAEDFRVPINAVFFRYLKDGDAEYLARTWLVDPTEVADSGTRATKETWNGTDFYVSFGEGDHRAWEDARKYGFVSAGGGSWYIKTLSSLFVGARVFVHVPQQGYVGVGKVIETAQPVTEFMVELGDGAQTPILDAPLAAPGMGEWAHDPERVETIVRVQWLKAIPVEDAIWEQGFFANQNSACKLRNRFTIERLVARFDLDE